MNVLLASRQDAMNVPRVPLRSYPAWFDPFDVQHGGNRVVGRASGPQRRHTINHHLLTWEMSIGLPAFAGTSLGLHPLARATAFWRPWRKAVAAVRVLAGRCLGGSRRAVPTARQAGNGTQITYANPRSCVPIFLKYDNKSDRLRAGFDRQAGGARRFAGSAG
jgi:hypothetical protein